MEYKENIKLAVSGLIDHKFRSFLTMLGIIFGVASVIAMLSIGEGAKREAIAKYQDLGVTNIIIRDKKLSDNELEKVRAKFSKGLSLQDAKTILDIVPNVVAITSQAEKKSEARYADKSLKISVVGVTKEYPQIMNIELGKGKFITNEQYNRKFRVCVIGSGVAYSFFRGENPLGKMIKVDDQWLEVVGVMKPKALFTETVGELAARDLNNDIYLPLSTFLSRFPRENALESEIQQVTVKVASSEKLKEVAKLSKEILKRHHFENDDYDIIVPYELMKQEEKERQIYNFLLGAIAAISLLVGGIGIMNIMLANVMERTREIGVRRAIGAKKQDILGQFLTEAVVISVTGGMIGVLVGITLSLSVRLFTDVTTSIQAYSVFVAFAFSVLVGIAFGYLPAKNAANLNPIDSIRYE